MNQEEFEALLVAFSSKDSAAKKAAEDRYTTFRDNSPALAMQCLLEVAANGKTSGVNHTALVLLRKMFVRGARCVENISAEEQDDVCGRLLELFASATGRQRKEVTACVSALATKMHQLGRDWSNAWDGILGAMADRTAGSSLRGSSCEVVEATATVFAPTFSAPRLKELASGLASCVSDDNSDVKAAAMKAIHDVVSVLDDKRLEVMKPLVGPMLEGLEATLNNAEWEGAKQLCGGISSIMENCPKLVRKNATPILEAMMHIASEFEVDVGVRVMAIEVMACYVEAEPKVVKKLQGFAESLIELMFKYMLEKNYPEDWATTREGEVSAVLGFDMGATAIDRVTKALPGKVSQTVCSKLFAENVDDKSAANRVAALNLIMHSAEGLAQAYVNHLDVIIAAIIPRCADSDPHVREAALLCLTQLADDLSPMIQMNHREVLDAATAALDDSIPRLQGLAITLIDIFFEKADDVDNDGIGMMFSGRYEPIVLQLVALYSKTTYAFVKYECLAAMSALINIAKGSLIGTIKAVMPIFQEAMDTEGTSDDAKNSRRKALECASLLACGVGWDAFAEYADGVCEHLNAYFKKNPPTDDPGMSFYLRGWTCMIECMQERSVPHLDVAIPAILRVADMKCDIEVIADDFGDLGELQDTAEVKYARVCRPGQGEQILKIRSGDVDRKEVAMAIVKTVLEMLKTKLPEKFVGPIISMISSNLQFSASTEVRSTTAEVLGLLADVFSDDSAKVSDLLDLTLTPLQAALIGENDLSVAEQLLLALAGLLKAAPPKSVGDAKSILEKLSTVLGGSATQRSTLKADANPAESDDDEDGGRDAQIDELNTMQGACTLAIGAALAQDPIGGGSCFVTQILPTIEPLVKVESSSEEQQMGMVLLHEFLDKAPEAAIEYMETLSNIFLHFAAIPDTWVCRHGLWGLTLCLRVIAGQKSQPDEGSATFAKAVHDLVLSYLRTNAVRDSEWSDSTCNAMSTALMLIDKFEVCDYSDLFQALVSHLPSRGDDAEVVIGIHSRIVAMMAANHPLVASDEVRKGIISLLTNAQRGPFGQRFTALLDEKTKQTLEKLS